MENKNPILHILVVGFHHKKGCQVEFSYPPLIAESEGKQECPSGWKYLPTLALPDGSHNFNKDFVCFNLPSLTDPHESIYGISCYRQIPVEKLQIRTADMTRSTVQKAVCALLSIPIYGYVEVKLSLIAHAFFEQGDFSCTDLLVKAYDQQNACLYSMEPLELAPARLHFVGLPLRELVLKWRHKLLMLYKLLMLQKRVICFGSPVQPTCALILGVVSLHPELLSKGFQQVACVKTSRPMSPMPNFSTPQEEAKKFPSEQNSPTKECSKVDLHDTQGESSGSASSTAQVTVQQQQHSQDTDSGSASTTREITPCSDDAQPASLEDDALGGRNGTSGARPGLVRETSVDTIASNFSSLCAIKPEEWAAPMRIFHEGNLCLPYLSLPYMDLLTDPSVKGYIIGASNVLFQQKRQLADVLIDVENAIIDVYDLDLKRQAQLSTEDLRFADFIIRNVQNPKEDAEGSEVWIREQFYGYVVALLKASLCQEGSKDLEHFNAHFMSALKGTQCYQDWLERSGGEANHVFEGLVVGHPFAGNLSVADMKLRIAQTMQNSESGRKLNQAVNTTSRAVGGAISTAKGAFSTWWTSITAPVPTATATADQNEPPSTNSNNNNEEDEIGGQCSESSGCDDDDDQDSSYSESDRSRSNRNKTAPSPPLSPSSQIATAKVTAEKTNNIIEIGKEAELLDRKPKIIDI